MYIPVKLNLNQSDLRKIVSGGNVKLTKDRIGHGHDCHVTSNQMKRLQKVHGGEMGHMLFKMSPAHLKRNIKHGGSFWGSLKDIGLAGLKGLAPVALDAGADYLKGKVQGIGQKGNGIMDLLSVFGLGVKKRKAPKKKTGRAVSLANVFKRSGRGTSRKRKAGKGIIADLLKMGTSGLVDYGTKKLGLGAKRKRVPKRGSGFLGDMLKLGTSGLVNYGTKKLGIGIAKPKRRISGSSFRMP